MNLNLQEKKILLSLNEKDEQTAEQLAKSTVLSPDAVSHACAWLSSKALIEIDEEISEILELDAEGLKYANDGLPERKLLDTIKDGRKSMRELIKELKSIENAKIATVWLIKLKAASILEGVVSITPAGKKFIDEKMPQEEALHLVVKKKDIPPNMKEELDKLKKRGKVLKVTEKKKRTYKLTKTGKELAKKGFSMEEEVSVITSKMIKTGEWKKKKLRKYDVEAIVPTVHPGKKQMYRQFLDEAREALIGMGFKEMRGPIVEMEFWNFDALFQPQNHPARTEEATYYLKAPKQGHITEKELKEKIKEAHEKGVGESAGWGYEWSETVAKKLMLRTHTTDLSARTIFKGITPPARYFSIGRNFRRDVIDASHLPEFNHLEGIVVDESLTFRDLLGMLEAFALEVAHTDKIKFKPAYFPYTEPSVELFAKHPDIGWTELGGAGIFRPEMLEPLGCELPIIAWGLGIDRLAMFKLGLGDIRDLFSKDLDVLRKAVL